MSATTVPSESLDTTCFQLSSESDTEIAVKEWIIQEDESTRGFGICIGMYNTRNLETLQLRLTKRWVALGDPPNKFIDSIIAILNDHINHASTSKHEDFVDRIPSEKDIGTKIKQIIEDHRENAMEKIVDKDFVNALDKLRAEREEKILSAIKTSDTDEQAMKIVQKLPRYQPWPAPDVEKVFLFLVVYRKFAYQSIIYDIQCFVDGLVMELENRIKNNE